VLDRSQTPRETVDPRPHHTDGYTLARAMLLVFLVSAADVTNFLDRASRGGWIRYVILLSFPMVAIVAIRGTHPSTIIRRMSASDRVLMVLFLLGLAGGVYGKVFNNVGSDVFPVFVPLIIAFLYLGTRFDVTDEEARKLLNGLVLVMFVYILLSAFVNSGLVPRLEAYRQYKNAQVMFLAMGVAAVIALKRPVASFIAIALWLFIFKSYPSATAFLVGVTTIVTLFITRPKKANNTRLILVGTVVAVVAILGILNFGSARNISDSYFNLVNKKNNDNARVALWQGGIRNFEKSPVWGQAFTGEATILVIRRGGLGQPFKAPFHSDYVLFLSLGGLLGLGLLVGWVVVTEVTVYRRYQGFVRSGEANKARLARVLLVGFNGFFCAAAFNPEFTGASRTATIAAIYGLMMLLGKPGPPMEAEDAPAPRLARFVPLSS
jgi:O-Antigen ligase